MAKEKQKTHLERGNTSLKTGQFQSECMNVNLPPKIYIHKELIHIMKFILYVVGDHFNQPTNQGHHSAVF